MRFLLLAVGISVVVFLGCSGAPTPPDAGTASDAGSGDAGDSGPPFSACGHPNDPGNSKGVGKYCSKNSDCPNTAQICSDLVNGVVGPSQQSYYCTTQCDPCGNWPAVCGESTVCVCQLALGGCGCVPSSCSAIIPDGGNPPCPDAGPDSGQPDA